MDVRPVGSVVFPLRLTLTFDPLEPREKNVPPELIQPFFFDERTGQWSTAGLTPRFIDVSQGKVEFETTHLTVFRLGVPRGRPPLIQRIQPERVAPGDRFVVLGRGFSLPAAQNLLTVGGAFVLLAQDGSGAVEPLALQDGGETLTLKNAAGDELDRAVLPAAPARNSSWTRQVDGDLRSAFVDHATVAGGRLFSPGTKANGDAFGYLQGTPSRAPAHGELLINEALLAPPASFLGDANGDGETNALEDEFVELVNTTSHPLELGGCTLSTGAGVRHTFTPGTILPGGMSLVIFGVEDPAKPPQPSGSFGGKRFFPDVSTTNQFIARLPEDAAAGTTFLTATTFRQTSNPVSLQVITPLTGRPVSFKNGSDQLPGLAGRQPRLVRMADVDRDLDLDLLAVDGQTGLLVLTNDGFGQFTEATGRVTLPDVGRSHFFDLAAVDLNEDGAPDLIIGDTDPDGTYVQLIILENAGHGRFQPLSNIGVLSSPGASGPTTLAVGDVDGDGDLDVVVGMIGDKALIFRNDGTGHFTHDPADVLPQEQMVVPTHVELIDVDGDGDLDVLLAAGAAGLGRSTALQLFLNDGSGRFQDATATHLPRNTDGVDAVAVGDLDGDGDLDILVGSHSTSTRLYRNDGTGFFTEETTGRIDSLNARALAVADVNGDGHADVIASKPPRDEVFLNDGTGHFTAVPPVPETTGDHREVTVADIDNDGDVDLLGDGTALRLLINAGRQANHPPVLAAVGEQVVSEGNLLQFDVQATDADGDPMTLDARLRTGGPPSDVGASFADHGSGTGTFMWTPAANQGERGGKPYEFVIRASDGTDADEEIVRVVVHDFNRSPSLSPVDAQTVDELQPVTIQLQASDPDIGDALTFGALGLPPGATLGSANGLFQWTPNAHQGDGPAGRHEYPITFTVTDLAQVTSSQSVTITVLNRNHAPVFTTVSPRTMAEGQLLTLTLDVHDPDDDPITVSAPDLPSGATFDAASRRFEWTPTFLQGRVEPYVARFQATDGELTGTLELSITVTNVNRPPRFVDLNDQVVDEGQTLQFIVTVEDADGDPLTVSTVGPLPPGAVFDPATRQFQWTADFSQAGQYPVTFQATDGIDTVRQTIHVGAVNVNRSPVLTPVGDRSIREGDLLQFAIQVSDPDGDPLTVSVVPLPTGAQVLHQGQAFLFQWVPDQNQQGTYPLEVHVSDGSIEVVGGFTITVLNNPGLQRLVAQAGMAQADVTPEQTPLGQFGDVSSVTFTPGSSLGLDLGQVHPALVSTLELFNTAAVSGLTEGDLALFVSDDNVTYRTYSGPLVFSTAGNRVTLSNLQIPQRFIKIHRAPVSVVVPTSAVNITLDFSNFLSEIVRASGAIPVTGSVETFLNDLGQKTFLYFLENVSANGLIPDRVVFSGGQVLPGTVYSTAATGFWLASLPIAAARGWITQQQAEAFAKRTLEFYLGLQGGPVAGQFGFFHHFLNGDGTRFTGFGGDGVSIIDSTLLFAGALASGEYFGGTVQSLAQQLNDQADWNAFYDPSMHMLRLFWTEEDGFIRHLDYTSEGILAYLLAAGSNTHPVSDPALPSGADAYYAYSRGNFGRVLGRFGRDGRPLLQSFFGSLFTYLYPPLLVDLGGVRDAFGTSWEENAREAILANFRFAQEHPEAGYGRLVWGISASDGPSGYQGLYGTPPLDPGAVGGPVHDGTVAPYALAGSLPFAGDLALPAIQHLASLQNGRLLDRYGLKDGVNVLQGFFASDYLGIDEGALLLGLEQYRTGLIGQLVRRSAILQRAFAQLGLRSDGGSLLEPLGPRSAHAYLRLDTTDHLTQTIHFTPPLITLAGDLLLELHPYGMDTTAQQRFVDVDVAVNGQFVKTVRFMDRRGDGTVDVGSVYVPISPSLLQASGNTVTLTWVGGERWLQLKDVGLDGPTGRRGNQETWQVGQRDGTPGGFGDERLVDDSYLVGDDLGTFEKALNVVDEPRTDLLFELSDAGVDRLLRLVVVQTQDGRPVTVEVSVNDGIAGQVVLRSGEEGTVEVPHALLREGWNHIVLRHAGVPGDGGFIVWDHLALEHHTGSASLQVFLRDVQTNQLAPQLQFGFAPPEGAVLTAGEYLEVHFDSATTLDHITIATDNRNGPIHRFTGPSGVSAAGLVGEIDSTIVAPLLWQVYDEPIQPPPGFTDTIEWAYVPDMSDTGFDNLDAARYRSLMMRDTLGDRPRIGRPGSSPIVVYLAVDFRGKPAQLYGTDRVIIERFEQ